MQLPDKVTLREVAMRDGLQSLKHFVPTEQKREIIAAVVEAGIRRVEATSFVSPRAVPQLKDAAALMGDVPRGRATYAALVPNARGALDAVAAGADEIVVVISASEAHNRENIRRSIDASLAELEAVFEIALSAGVDVIGSVAVSFGCPFQGDVPEADVFRIVAQYVRRGARSVILADTTGMAGPTRVARRVTAFRERFPDTRLVLHFHNNRGTAMANLLAALQAGADCFDTALGGIGGCPYVPQAAGNLATADVVFMLEEVGVETGVDLQKLIPAARRLEEILGFTLPGQVMKSGPRDPRLAARICGIGRAPAQRQQADS